MQTTKENNMPAFSTDVHAHLAPINVNRINLISGVEWNAQNNSLIVDGHKVGISNLFSPSKLLEWLDQNNIDKALVSIPPPLYRQQLSATDSTNWSQYLNDELLAIKQASNGKLGALIYLPAEHPDVSLDLLNRYKLSQFDGVALAAGGHPKIDYSALEYTSIWEILNQNNSFTFIHPGTCADPRLSAYYLENLVGNPHETGIAASHLIMAGIPSKFPNIRFCLAHGGGSLTSLIGRLEKGFDTSRPGLDLNVERPLQAVKRFYADCICHDASLLAHAQKLFGNDHVLFGSDWPFPMGITDPATFFQK